VAKITTIPRSHLHFSARIDAEHYSPRFTQVLRQIGRLRTVSLRRLLSEPVKTGHTPSTKNSAYYDSDTVKFVKTDNLREDRIDTGDAQFLSELGNSKIGASELRPDDVILTIIGATEKIIGRAARVHRDTGRANINQNVALIRSRIPAGFLTVFLNTPYGRGQLIWLSRQTGQVNLNCREVEELAIPLFSNKFVAAVHESNNQMHRLLFDSTQIYADAEKSLLSKLGLLDWRPAPALAYVRKYSQVARSRRTDAEYFQPKFQEMFDRLPASLGLDLLGKLTTHKKGVEVGSSAYADSGIPFWRVSNLSKHGLDDSNANFISDALYSLLRASYEPQPGEMLLSKDATPGLACYLATPTMGIVSSGILRLAMVDDIPPYYLELVLNSLFVQMQMEQDSGGSVIKHWKPSSVLKTLIPRLLPSEENHIAHLVQQSHAARREAKGILEKAKRAVEIAIEKDEDHGLECLGGP
jgi:hypothetical protein